MSSYARVRDYREQLLRQKPNVEIYLNNRLSAEDIVALEIPHILVATGSSWRRDGIGRQHSFPPAGIAELNILTPDDIMNGAMLHGRVLIYDDDHYYMGSTLAELCRNQGHEVCLLTPQSCVSMWAENTLEQGKIQARVLSLGIELFVSHRLVELVAGEARIANVYSEQLEQKLAFDSLVMVTSRAPQDELYQALLPLEEHFKTLRAIGDCNAPGTVAAAVYDGHAAARSLESEQDFYAPLFAREMPACD